jgi:hypothetical protein
MGGIQGECAHVETGAVAGASQSQRALGAAIAFAPSSFAPATPRVWTYWGTCCTVGALPALRLPCPHPGPRPPTLSPQVLRQRSSASIHLGNSLMAAANCALWLVYFVVGGGR